MIYSFNVSFSFLSDKNCSTDIDECAFKPCKNGGHCQDLIGEFYCSCLPGKKSGDIYVRNVLQYSWKKYVFFTAKYSFVWLEKREGLSRHYLSVLNNCYVASVTRICLQNIACIPEVLLCNTGEWRVLECLWYLWKNLWGILHSSVFSKVDFLVTFHKCIIFFFLLFYLQKRFSYWRKKKMGRIYMVAVIKIVCTKETYN